MAGSVIFVFGMLAGDVLNGLTTLGLLAIGLIGRILLGRRAIS